MLLRRAAAGRFPPVDGAVEVVRPYRHGVHGLVSFTGHAVAVTDLPLEALLAAGVDGFDGATSAAVTALLAGPDGEPDVLDALLVAPGRGPSSTLPARAPGEAPASGEAPSSSGASAPGGGGGGAGLPPRPDLADHPRVAYAHRFRDDVRVHGDERGLVTLARGIGGLSELSFEVPPDRRGRGHGRSLLADALRLVPAGEPVLASVAPGNAASFRALLAAGFTPIGSVQLIAVRR